MKQKLFLLSSLLALVVSFAFAWTGVDNAWWQSQGYTSSEQTYYQTTLRTSAEDWALGIVPENVSDGDAPSSSSFTLTWDDYDVAADSIIDLLKANEEILPTTVYDDIKKTYDDALQLKKDVERDWHSVAFRFGTIGRPSPAPDYQTGTILNRSNYYFVNRYSELQAEYTIGIGVKTGKLKEAFQEAKKAVEIAKMRLRIADRINDANEFKASLTDEAAQLYIADAVTDATTVKDDNAATLEELTNTLNALSEAMRTGRWMDDVARLEIAIQTKVKEAEALPTGEAKSTLNNAINTAIKLLADLKPSVNTAVTTDDVTNMIAQLGVALDKANIATTKDNIIALLADAAQYSELIPDEIADAQNAVQSATVTLTELNAIGGNLFEALARAESYTTAKKQLEEAIAAAELAEEKDADYEQLIADAKSAAGKAYVDDNDAVSAIVFDMQNALTLLDAAIDQDRWSHKPIAGKFIVKPWKSNNPDPNQVQYLKLVGKYTSADAQTANSAVDLFVTDITQGGGTYNFLWTPFDANTDYEANSITVSSEGVEDLNNYAQYGWAYNEYYNDIIVKSGTILSEGYGELLSPNQAYSWNRVWNTYDIDITDKDSLGNYIGRYYTFEWSESPKGGVYRVPTELSIYDETGDVRKVEDLQIYLSKPSADGTYFVNADLADMVLTDEPIYDNTATLFDFENGTAVLKGEWHHVQFIDKNQFIFHQAAQKAADWYNNAEDLRHYDTAALLELKKAVETDGVDWLPQADRIKAAMEKVQNSINKVNMLVGDSLYGVIADGAYADVERTYTVTGAPGDKIDAKIIAQTNDGWTKDDTQYWTIISNGDVVGADSTTTVTVKFMPGATYPADFREYRAVLDVKVGNLSYQDQGKDSLQQNLYGANPKLSLGENDLIQAHSLNLHRKDSITYVLYGRGYAYLYEKSPLKATFYDANDVELGTSEVKNSFVKSQFTAYASNNDLDQTEFTVSYYPEDLGADVVKVVLSDTIRKADDVVLTVNAAKSQITFDPATVTDINQNSIKLEKMGDGTEAYFYPADGETYLFPITVSNFEGVNANTVIANEDGVISITTDVLDPATGLVVEHVRHDVQITIDNREYYTVEADAVELNSTGPAVFTISVKTNKLTQGTTDDGQHNGLLQIIWQDQDTIKVHLNQTQPYFSTIDDVVAGDIVWEFTEAGDKVWYVDVIDVDNYYNFPVNFGAYTNTDWFIVDQSVSYQLTPERGTRRYRLKITYNPHEANTVYEDKLTLNIFDTKRHVIVATQTLLLKGEAVSAVKGGATGVDNAEAEEAGLKDGKFIKDNNVIIVKDGKIFEASGAQQK